MTNQLTLEGKKTKINVMINDLKRDDNTDEHKYNLAIQDLLDNRIIDHSALAKYEVYTVTHLILDLEQKVDYVESPAVRENLKQTLNLLRDFAQNGVSGYGERLVYKEFALENKKPLSFDLLDEGLETAVEQLLNDLKDGNYPINQ